MEGLDKLQKELASLEKIRAARRRATARHYSKWIKGEGLSDLEKDEAEKKREYRKGKQKVYYESNRDKILERQRSKYVPKKKKKSTTSSEEEQEEQVEAVLSPPEEI